MCCFSSTRQHCLRQNIIDAWKRPRFNMYSNYVLKKCMFNLDMFFLEKYSWIAWKDAGFVSEKCRIAAGNCTHICSISKSHLLRNIACCETSNKFVIYTYVYMCVYIYIHTYTLVGGKLCFLSLWLMITMTNPFPLESYIFSCQHAVGQHPPKTLKYYRFKRGW